MAIGKIQNDTMSVGNDNIEFMKSQIASELTNSGLVMISTANGRAYSPQGEKAVAPTLMLHGRLVQRDFRREDGQKQREFTLVLSIVDLASGIQVWTGKSAVGIVCD